MEEWETCCNADCVALRTEGVDRNLYSSAVIHAIGSSPSARRAWIEIMLKRRRELEEQVALRTEGVDRNRVGWCRPPHGGRG